MQGTIRKIGIEGGVWALITDDGQQIELIGAPDGLKQNGARARIEADEEKPVDVSIGMIGSAVRVKSFEILD
ncbi:MAG: hypothetical protein AB8I08_12175 [Sandaracinaceae bacterium]